MHRRHFLARGLTAAAAAPLVLRDLRSAPPAARLADARIEVLPGEAIGLVTPNLHSHFVEHIGGVIYDGIWVGEGSRVPNVGGVRRALVEHLRPLRPGVVRWPGGCFAETYDWRDGVGPRGARPRRTNFWEDNRFKTRPRYDSLAAGPAKYEPNAFGTDEFVRFCRLVGAEPYLAVDVRSRGPRDFVDWVEYCNAPAGLTTNGDLRVRNGGRDPHRVRYWGVGNEPWGCGGDFTPAEYAAAFRRYTTWVPTYEGRPNVLVAGGPDGGDVAWTRGFLAALTERGRGYLDRVGGLSLHYYTQTGNKPSTEFTPGEYYDVLARAGRMEALVAEHWAVMGELDPERKVKLVVDEWGAWEFDDGYLPAGFLYGYRGTLRSALVAALTLDTFHRHADKVLMANVAQLVNNIHSLFIAHEDRFAATPNYHVFAMYAAHQGGRAVRAEFAGPAVRYAPPGGRAGDGRAGEGASLSALQGSATVHAAPGGGAALVLTAVNPSTSDAVEAEVAVRGMRVGGGEAVTLTAPDVHAYNSFEQPRAVVPTTAPVAAPAGATLVYRFPPASVTRLRLALA